MVFFRIFLFNSKAYQIWLFTFASTFSAKKTQKSKVESWNVVVVALLKPAVTCRCLTQCLIKPNRNRIFLFLHFCFPPLIFLHTTTKYKTFWRISGLNNTHFSWGETVKLLTGLRKISLCPEKVSSLVESAYIIILSQFSDLLRR